MHFSIAGRVGRPDNLTSCVHRARVGVRAAKGAEIGRVNPLRLAMSCPPEITESEWGRISRRGIQSRPAQARDEDDEEDEEDGRQIMPPTI